MKRALYALVLGCAVSGVAAFAVGAQGRSKDNAEARSKAAGADSVKIAPANSGLIAPGLD